MWCACVSAYFLLRTQRVLGLWSSTNRQMYVCLFVCDPFLDYTFFLLSFDYFYSFIHYIMMKNRLYYMYIALSLMIPITLRFILCVCARLFFLFSFLLLMLKYLLKFHFSFISFRFFRLDWAKKQQQQPTISLILPNVHAHAHTYTLHTINEKRNVKEEMIYYTMISGDSFVLILFLPHSKCLMKTLP